MISIHASNLWTQHNVYRFTKKRASTQTDSVHFVEFWSWYKATEECGASNSADHYQQAPTTWTAQAGQSQQSNTQYKSQDWTLEFWYKQVTGIYLYYLPGCIYQRQGLLSEECRELSGISESSPLKTHPSPVISIQLTFPFRAYLCLQLPLLFVVLQPSNSVFLRPTQRVVSSVQHFHCNRINLPPKG